MNTTRGTTSDEYPHPRRFIPRYLSLSIVVSESPWVSSRHFITDGNCLDASIMTAAPESQVCLWKQLSVFARRQACSRIRRVQCVKCLKDLSIQNANEIAILRLTCFHQLWSSMKDTFEFTHPSELSSCNGNCACSVLAHKRKEEDTCHILSVNHFIDRHSWMNKGK